MTSPLYTEESSSETAMEGSLEVFWAETIEPENTPIEIKLSKNRKINLQTVDKVPVFAGTFTMSTVFLV